MRPSLRTLTISGLAAAALLLGACGVEGGDASPAATTAPATDGPSSDRSTTTTAPDAPLSPREQQARDTLVETYTDMGFKPDEAECMADALTETLTEGEALDPNDAMSLFNDCDIPASRMGEVMDELGGGSLSDTMRNALVTSLTNGGLSKEQATCVADAYIDEYGTDATSIQDPKVIEELFTTCKVDKGSLPGN